MACRCLLCDGCRHVKLADFDCQIRKHQQGTQPGWQQLLGTKATSSEWMKWQPLVETMAGNQNVSLLKLWKLRTHSLLCFVVMLMKTGNQNASPLKIMDSLIVVLCDDADEDVAVMPPAVLSWGMERSRCWTSEQPPRPPHDLEVLNHFYKPGSKLEQTRIGTTQLMIAPFVIRGTHTAAAVVLALLLSILIVCILHASTAPAL